MNIVILTVEERLYLPALFQRFLQERASDTRAIFRCPPGHRKQSTIQMIRKYRAAFGWLNSMRLARRELWARCCDRLGFSRTPGRAYSVASVANHFGVPCMSVRDVNSESFLQQLSQLRPDLIVSVSCPQIFKKPLIELPTKGCLNIHGALLPQYRGLAPSFWMMHNGEREAGVTVFFVNEAIDLGDVVEVERFPILPEETLEQFIIRSRQIHAAALLRALTKIERGDSEGRPLSAEGGSYHTFPTREAYREFRRRGRRLW
jgi:methionyl-tRNA formyltransferase